MNIKLSIIIPVYNLEEYIGFCLNSVLNQDVSKDEYEIICVDDGSTDNSLSILKKYEENYNNVVVIHKENGGVSSARNVGLDNAKGEYICFLDGDDSYIPNTLSKIFNSLGTADIVQFNMTKISENFEKENKNYDISGYTLEMCNDLLWNKILKKSIIKKHNVRFIETMRYSEDIFFIYHYCCFAKTKEYLYDFVYLYRQRKSSIIHTRNKFRYIEQVDSVKQFCLLSKNVLLPKSVNNVDFQKELVRKLNNYGKTLLYLSPLTNEKKRNVYKFVNQEKFIRKEIKTQSWKTAKYCKEFRYKLKFLIFDLLRYKLFYYLFFDITKIILKIKRFK